VHASLTPSEAAFFARLRAHCSPAAWPDAQKLLELFSLEVLSRHELLALLADVLPAPQVEEVRALLAGRGGLEMTAQDAWFSLPVGDLDLSQEQRITPSYVALPAAFPVPPCSERSALEREVCNDRWVSVPGSDDASFVATRKNQYEDALFACEDERYEVSVCRASS